MGFRRKARECGLQMLFQIDLSGCEAGWVRREFWKANPSPDPVRQFADRLVEGAVEHRLEIDRKLAEIAENWRLDRMSTVDRNVLRMAMYELTYERGTPAKVVINEAIDIAKKFGTEQSAAFVNGVLDAAMRELDSVRAGN